MPHSPPVPPGNQSPYPHVEASQTDPGAAKAVSSSNAKSAGKHDLEDRSSRGGLAAILGIGVLGALVAGMVAFTRSADAKTSSGKKTKRSKG
jgi:Mn2+/Fe2+ NRAMP family transporter